MGTPLPAKEGCQSSEGGEALVSRPPAAGTRFHENQARIRTTLPKGGGGVCRKEYTTEITIKLLLQQK